jgi:LPXTG-motif cell wall-anchored protein
MPISPSLSSSESTAVSSSGAVRGESSGAGFRNSPVITYAIGSGASASSSPSADGSSKWTWIGAAVIAGAAGLYFITRRKS